MGYSFYGPKTAEAAIKEYGKFPLIFASLTEKTLSYSVEINIKNYPDDYIICYSLGEFINEVIKVVSPVEIKVELNLEYHAIVTKEDIAVGCQKFTHEMMDKLHEASLLARK